MKSHFLEELWHAIWREISGRQDPSSYRKIASVLVKITILLIGIKAGMMIQNASIEPSANVVFSPYEIDDNLSVPIDITNGQKPLSNINVFVKTCQMAKAIEFEVPDLIERQDYRVKLRDEDTVLALNVLFNGQGFNCGTEGVSVDVQCWIQPYIVENKLYVPPQECKRYRCGTCGYEIQLKSKEYTKNFTSSFKGAVPRETYTYKITPPKVLNISLEEAIPFSPIGISIFSPYDICMFETNYSFDECKTYPIERIYSQPMNFTLVPTNQSLGNFSVTITQEINEFMKQRILRRLNESRLVHSQKE